MHRPSRLSFSSAGQVRTFCAERNFFDRHRGGGTGGDTGRLIVFAERSHLCAQRARLRVLLPSLVLT